MNIFTVLPDLPTKPFANILPSLERNQISVADLLSLDAPDVAKRAQIPIREVRRLTDAILQLLHVQYGLSSDIAVEDASAAAMHAGDASAASSSSLVRSGLDLAAQWQSISLLDDTLDAALGGGIPTGYVTEITGESGVGKTQLLLTLLLSVQLAAPHGLNRSAMYISTEAPLSTSRLSQILSSHPSFSSLASDARPVLSRILSIQTPDLEAQDHILRYQVPVAVKRENVGLLVIDSITANYRAELERRGDGERPGASMAKRSAQLMELGTLLRDLARTENIAVVVANQVADRFRADPRPERGVASSNPNYGTAGVGASPMPSQNPPHASEPGRVDDVGDAGVVGTESRDPLTLDHQQRWFSGWGDGSRAGNELGLKTPSLGLIWTNQIACRIALRKRRVYHTLATPTTMQEPSKEFQPETSRWSRHMKLVFAPWAASADGTRGVEFCIEKAGLQAVKAPSAGD